ncbi:nucleoside 2-deoxyribosyltransferase domain-containing protein [Dokdonia ponticola]|uniref:Nucleoside 2-deoxyribosyltransferase domain-containing protein n=1 Tax=Dokdonia ponticola TaxID=2041041 RepID=A0ABV9HTA9_9FLAO
MIFTSQQQVPKKKSEHTYTFLAGSMDDKLTTPWREEVMHILAKDTHFFDPTNKKHNSLSKKEMKRHVEWELDALSISDKILLNFLPDALSPISLVELGLYVASGKLIVICPKGFYKSGYVYTLCEKYKTPIFENLTQALSKQKSTTKL